METFTEHEKDCLKEIDSLRDEMVRLMKMHVPADAVMALAEAFAIALHETGTRGLMMEKAVRIFGEAVQLKLESLAAEDINQLKSGALKKPLS